MKTENFEIVKEILTPFEIEIFAFNPLNSDIIALAGVSKEILIFN